MDCVTMDDETGHGLLWRGNTRRGVCPVPQLNRRLSGKAVGWQYNYM